MIGDGLTTNKGDIRICICDKEIEKIVQGLFEKLFKDKGKVYGHWAYTGGVELRAYLRHLGLKYAKSYEKTVPKSIFTASKENCAAFIRGIFDTDGCVRLDGRNKNTKRIHFSTTSLKLAEEVQLLLLNFNIISKIYPISMKEENKGYIKGRKINSFHTRYDLVIKGSYSVRMFLENIGFGLRYKQKILEKSVPKKRNLRIIPNQKNRITSLFKKLPLEEQRMDICKISRFTRSSKGKATKNLTYEKLQEFIISYEKFLKNEPDFINLQKLFYMGHYYSKVKRKIPSFAHTYDLNIPLSHTFTANGIVCHNSGKDSSKVDRSAAYMARYIAKNIVAADLADKCEVKFAYTIGQSNPDNFHIHTFGTGKLADHKLEEIALNIFDLRPAKIIQHLDLKRPIYLPTATYGHFGRESNNGLFPWEKTDMVNILKKKAKLKTVAVTKIDYL